jgi:hypothetical protein
MTSLSCVHLHARVGLGGIKLAVVVLQLIPVFQQLDESHAKDAGY